MGTKYVGNPIDSPTGRAICEALGLDANMVRKITLTLEAGEASRMDVEIEQYTAKGQDEALALALQQLKWRLAADPYVTREQAGKAARAMERERDRLESQWTTMPSPMRVGVPVDGSGNAV